VSRVANRKLRLRRTTTDPAGILKSFKLQASSLTTGPGDDRMNLERNI